MENLTTSARNMPKMSKTTLEIRKNYYVVPDGDLFHYFPLKVVDENTERPIFRIEKSPSVLMEGIAILGKRLYRVPVQDLMRGVIRKSREIQPANRVNSNGSTGNTTNPATLPGTGNGAVSNPTGSAVSADNNQHGTSSDVDLEVCEAADLAWEEQIQSLLSFISEKEGGEWQVENPAQSRRVDESNAIQDPDEGS